MDNYYNWAYKDDLHKLVASSNWLTTMTIIQFDSYFGKKTSTIPIESFNLVANIPPIVEICQYRKLEIPSI